MASRSAVSRAISSTTIRASTQHTTKCDWQSIQRRGLQTHTFASRTHLSPLPNRTSISRLAPSSWTNSPRKSPTAPARRTFASSPARQHGDLTPPKPGEERKVTFVDKEGQEWTFEVSDGDNLLDIAQANDLEMEGACGGSCACSTCHIIVAGDEMYDKMEEPSDDENDMLDLAFGLTETSRLGCQVVMSKELDGLVVKLPSMTRNLQASDFADKK
ncbi:Putative 2Fe-2S ferredoxin-type iron-sulfur binding domain, adrenodoxin [Septoria linicola]|uniref:2Fe-2S ferredoxin-type iron-sulfur binding domain, adrenodoxin n=1 Tax=Septoria linicola TaxID=215465 RepID=A0A9Q9EIL6_9PEZI|nr:putative 2Fe-2S ferredoxin-type iron-sulfur binding domain, adrenodoxin [Septoria linicola]USW51209.1 Putative 2Fe-2S ferredoxin-type iron-sulfur binding domain, adrenodoxin [Septoria linicola]